MIMTYLFSPRALYNGSQEECLYSYRCPAITEHSSHVQINLRAILEILRKFADTVVSSELFREIFSLWG